MFLFMLLLLLPTLALAQAPANCTHYASPTGTGATCTQPSRVKSRLVAPGWPGQDPLPEVGHVHGRLHHDRATPRPQGYAGQPHHRARGTRRRRDFLTPSTRATPCGWAGMTG